MKNVSKLLILLVFLFSNIKLLAQKNKEDVVCYFYSSIYDELEGYYVCNYTTNDSTIIRYFINSTQTDISGIDTLIQRKDHLYYKYMGYTQKFFSEESYNQKDTIKLYWYLYDNGKLGYPDLFIPSNYSSQSNTYDFIQVYDKDSYKDYFDDLDSVFTNTWPHSSKYTWHFDPFFMTRYFDPDGDEWNLTEVIEKPSDKIIKLIKETKK